MVCPKCGKENDRVVDTRPSDDNRSIRRRRECLECKFRFSTIERVEGLQLRVRKKDGTYEEFSRDKVLRGLNSACSKRPVSPEQLMSIINDIETEIQASRNMTLDSDMIGQMIMDRLAKLDKVAYVRFASVYRDFTDISSFKDEVDRLEN